MFGHLHDIPLDRAAQSSARWHGKRAGAALAAGDTGTANYETGWHRRMQHGLTAIQRADSDYIFDRARMETLRERRPELAATWGR